MDAARFDRLTMTLARTASRRGLTRLLLGLPLRCVVAARLGHLADVAAQQDDDHGSSHRRQRRKARHKHDPGSNNGHHPGKHKHHRKGKRKHKPIHDTPCLPPWTDLQAAIYAAQPGTTLVLCAGTWPVLRTILIDRSLGLRGAGAGSTVLYGLDPGRQARVQVFGIRPRIHVKLQGLTITDGGDEQGGGIFNQGNLWVIACAVVKNQAWFGAGIYNQGDLILTRGTIDQNFTVHPGSHWAPEPVTSPPCRGDFSAELGGGIYNTRSGTVSVRGTVITRNRAQVGAGIYNDSGTVELEAGSNVSSNTACEVGHGGGGIYNDSSVIFHGKVILKADKIVTGNTPDNCSPIGSVPNCKG